MLQITYFVHGTTTDNENGIASGWADPRLSEKGLKQIAALRTVIKPETFDAVFCSDLLRARDSARLLFGSLVPIIADARLRECNYGDYNSRTASLVDAQLEQHITKSFPAGESCETVKLRLSDFLEHLQQNYAGKSLALVAHKVPQLALEVLLNNKTWAQAFAEDWRKTGAWQPGWRYDVTTTFERCARNENPDY